MFLYICVVIGCIFAYFKYKFSYWSRLGVPTLPPTIPFGNIGNPTNRKLAFYESVAKVYAHFKGSSPYGGFYSITIPHLIPIDVDLIKRILITDFGHFVDRGLYYNEEADPLTSNLFFIGGPKWRTLRQRLTPTFTSGKMQSMFGIIVQCAAHLNDALQDYQGDVREILAQYSTEVIGSCAFGLDCSSSGSEQSEFRRYTKKIFEYSTVRTFQRILTMIWPWLCEQLGFRFVPEDVSDFFVQVVRDTVRMRKDKGLKRNDFLDLLLELEEQGIMDKREFAPQSFIFFIAGFETSSSTMSYLLYELSRNPDIQERCRKEIRETFPEGTKPNYEGVMTMKYIEQVVDETLRLYPILPFINRQCVQDYCIDANLTIKRGQKVIIPTLALHLDAEFYPNPNKFDPERFSSDNKSNIIAGTYLPFGEGPRKCIGLRFGLMQVKVGLVSILTNYRISTCPETPETLTRDRNGFTLKCVEDIVLKFDKLES